MVIKCNDANITEYVSSITWSGSASQASRSIEITIVNAPYDNNMTTLNIRTGDTLTLLDDNNHLLIQAMVYNRIRDSKSNTLTYKAYDGLNRLLRSTGVFNFKNTTPEKVAQLVCNEIKMPIGNIVTTNVPIKSMIIDGDTLYTILMKAYTKAHQVNGKKYMPLMVGKKFHMIERGEVVEGFILSESTNITGSTYEETIDNMVNKVKIYNKNGEQVGEATAQEAIDMYETFQAIYKVQDSENPITGATSLLKLNEQTANVTAIGNVACISGYGVQIQDEATGLTGIFWIETDSHTFSNGTHSMELELAFSNMMDVQEHKDPKASSKKKKASSKKTKGISATATVYVAENTLRYHSKTDCSNMKRPHAMTKAEAAKKGFMKCKRCW